MDSNDEHTLVFKAVTGVSVQEGGQTVAVEFQALSGQTIRVVIPAEASHTLSRMLMRAQIEAAAERGKHKPRSSERASQEVGAKSAEKSEAPTGGEAQRVAEETGSRATDRPV